MGVPVISIHWKTSSMLLCLNIAKLANRLLLRGYSTGLRPGSAWTMEKLELTSHTTLGITLTLTVINKYFWSQLCQQKASLYLPAGSCKLSYESWFCASSFQSRWHDFIPTAIKFICLTTWVVPRPCSSAMCKDHTKIYCEVFRAHSNWSQVLATEG